METEISNTRPVRYVCRFQAQNGKEAAISASTIKLIRQVWQRNGGVVYERIITASWQNADGLTVWEYGERLILE